MNLTQAKGIADKIINIFKPYCIRIEVAGSIRRQKPEVKDIEIVCIPDSYKLEQYFIDHKREYKFVKNGQKYKQFKYQGIINVDLFIANVNNWAMIYLIRTGSADYVKRMMIWLNKQGYTCKDGLLRKIGSEVISLLDESSFYRHFNIKYIEPENRK